MGYDVTLGGERLGAGNKQKIELHGYGRSTHNLSEVFRTTMASGTLVPFLNIVGLPGDTFEIDLELDVKTHPTIGPLFGSYKAQVDLFRVPIRLYQGKMHMNLLNIGNKISDIKLPIVTLRGRDLDITKEMAGQQVNPSALMSYLGVRGLAKNAVENPLVERHINAVPLLGYWDIYKNYYANKQEEIGFVIHHDPKPLLITSQISQLLEISIDGENTILILSDDPEQELTEVVITSHTFVKFGFSNSTEYFDPARITLWWFNENTGGLIADTLPNIFGEIQWNEADNTFTGRNPLNLTSGNMKVLTGKFRIDRSFNGIGDIEPQLFKFPLENIDHMRTQILMSAGENTAFVVNNVDQPPYNLMLQSAPSEENPELTNYSLTGNQEGLGIKTYLSDLFNNWINTEWIEGENGINEITAISTADGQITIDEINLSTKIYKMLNRIAVSDGTFDSWIKATYDHNAPRRVETPEYVGGMMQELVFQEVISNTATDNQPLGTLAGRGLLNHKSRKGGHVTIRVDEHSYIMGIVSLTPRIDYSQGNNWDINLRTMDDFHKPALDEIGFQDLITDQMAFWETINDPETLQKTFRSAGKQPAWTNYMTSVNKTFGNFALENEQMFMTLNRRYSPDGGTDGYIIKDLTTYIDPAKFNQIFAYTRRDAQNFWVQIGSNIKARRKMSAKVMPNL